MTEEENTDEKANPVGSSDNISLEQRYLYQSPTTGTASSTTLAVKQLCRMFSPPASSTARFSADTQVLALQADGTTYDPAGWKPARDVPVLRHAACNSFYYTQNKASQGPVSCRQLSTLRYQTEQPIDPEKDQVYGESTGNQWVLISSLPDLEVALEAFRDQPAVPTTTTNASANEDSKAQEYDVSVMIYEDDKPPASDETKDIKNEKEVQDELEAFLSSTDHMGPKGAAVLSSRNGLDDDEDDDEGYESDGGTKYVKDPRSGNWIHHSLAPPKPSSKTNPTQPPPNKKPKTQHEANNNDDTDAASKNKKKSKKAKFAAKNAKNWIYITGLPPDTTEDEVAKFFAKVGIIDLDPTTQRPKVKLYRHKTDTEDGAKAGTCKGDASICYARPESVELALQVLDEAPFRDAVSTNTTYRLHVERAKFEQQGDYTQRKRISQAQRKVAKLASKQAMDWDEGEINGRITGGLKGLRIIVLKGMFDPKDFSSEEEEDALLAELEKKVRETSEGYGAVEKITVFSKNPQGVVVVKFVQPGAASEAVKGWDGRGVSLGKSNQERKVRSCFWDGVEDFTVRDTKEEEDMAKRHDAFGDWIESHGEEELPEELRLRVEK